MSSFFNVAQHKEVEMERCSQPAMSVALLKRSDAQLWRVYSGDDWATFAAGIGREHCFDVLPVLVAPAAPDDAMDRLVVAFKAEGLRLHNGWFTATHEQAVRLLVQLLPTEPATDCSSDASAGADTYTTAPAGDVGMPVCASPSGCSQTEMPVCESPSDCNQTEMPVCESPSDSYYTDNEVVLLAMCEPCTSREASKASDVRACLEGVVDKPAASALLKRTRQTVAQDMSGRKKRVLKLGDDYLKLR
mgnify:CR=1 FL=1